MTEDGGLAVMPLAMALASVSLIVATVSHLLVDGVCTCLRPARYSGGSICLQVCLSDSRQASIHCSNGIHYPHWCSINTGGSDGNSETFCRLCNELDHNANHCA